VTPTSLRLLFVTATVGAVVGLLGARFWDLLTGAPPTVPWAAPAVLGLLAAVAGVYLGYAAFVMTDLNTAFRRQMLLVSLVASASGAALAAAALWLERICRIKGGDDDEAGGASPA
jgi:uncharacterized membrane protein